MSPSDHRTFGRVVVHCTQGDITDQPDVDAVVNAANAELAPGGGVAGAIHRVAGPELYEECRPLAPISTGQAVITGGYGLPNRWCIHVLGPVYGVSSDARGELAACYQNMLAVASSSGVESLATPAISTGVFGYPIAEAAEVAMETVATVASGLERVKVVRFVLWSESDYEIHARALERGRWERVEG